MFKFSLTSGKGKLLCVQSCRLALLEAVLDHPDLEELAIVIEAAELIGELADLEQVTLFAPNNNAFNGSNGLFYLLGFEGGSLADLIDSLLK
jgi:hypothetical protein